MKGTTTMAIRVELQKGEVERVLDAAIASLRRSTKTTINPMMIKIIEEDIGRYQNAKNTLTDVKKKRPLRGLFRL